MKKPAFLLPRLCIFTLEQAGDSSEKRGYVLHVQSTLQRQIDAQRRQLGQPADVFVNAALGNDDPSPQLCSGFFRAGFFQQVGGQGRPVDHGGNTDG